MPISPPRPSWPPSEKREERVDHHHRRAQCADETLGTVPRPQWRSLRYVVGGCRCGCARSLHQDRPPRGPPVPDQGTRLHSRPSPAAVLPEQQAGCARSSARSCTPRSASPCAARGRKVCGNVLVHQQGFQWCTRTGDCTCHPPAGPADFGEIGTGIDEQVADALVVLDHRYRCVLGDEADQAFTTARDGQVDQFVQLQQFQHGFATQVGQHRHSGSRGNAVGQRAAANAWAMAVLEWIASEPPRRITAVSPPSGTARRRDSARNSGHPFQHRHRPCVGCAAPPAGADRPAPYAGLSAAMN